MKTSFESIADHAGRVRLRLAAKSAARAAAGLATLCFCACVACMVPGCGGGGGHDDWPPDDAVETDASGHDTVGTDTGRDAAGDAADLDTPDAPADDVPDDVPGDTAFDAAADVTADAPPSEILQPDGLDAPDNLMDDAADDIDVGCVPACGAAECGVDPVCGTSCGSCGEGFDCISGKCRAPGCYYASSYVCIDSVVTADGETPDPAGMQQMCETLGGTWQLCPTDGLVASIRLTAETGDRVVSHFYAGLYCGIDDAMAAARREYPDRDAALLWGDPDAACGDETVDSIACTVTGTADPYCIEMARAVPTDKAQAWGAWCTGVLGGNLSLACPGQETGTCEEPPPFDGGWYTLTRYYAAGNLDTHGFDCTAINATWLATECNTESVPYGTCNLDVRGCGYPAGAWQQLHYEIWITEPVSGSQGHACCYSALEDAFQPAFDDLVSRDDLARCLPAG